MMKWWDGYINQVTFSDDVVSARSDSDGIRMGGTGFIIYVPSCDEVEGIMKVELIYESGPDCPESDDSYAVSHMESLSFRRLWS